MAAPSMTPKLAQLSQSPELSPSSMLPPTRPLLTSCIIVLTVASSMLINIANSTAVSIALPTIQKEMKLEPAQLPWIMSAYPLSSGCLFLVCGRLADVYGRKRTFLVGSFLLAVFTLACGFSNDVLTLDILRGIQGIGAAATIPASLGILAHAFAPSRARTVAFATFSAGAPLGGAFGMALGGILTAFTPKTWRSSFYLLSGMTFLCFVVGLIFIDDDVPSEEVDKRIDWLGALLVTSGLILIIFALSQGKNTLQGWATPYVIALLVLGVMLIGLFLLWQHYLEKVHDDPFSSLTPPPLLKLSIWTRANGRIAAIVMIAFTNWAAFVSWVFWVQLYYQNYVHYTAMQTVIRFLPMFASGITCNIIVGFMAARVPMVWLVGVGSLATTSACLLFAIIDPSTTYWSYGFAASVASAMGGDFVFSAGTLFIAKSSLPHEQSVSAALFSTMTQLGSAVGITVTTVVFNSVGSKIRPGEDPLPMYRAAQWACFAFGVIATTLGFTFFRGVGVVGHRAPEPDSITENEKGEPQGERMTLQEDVKEGDKMGTSVVEYTSNPKPNARID
ncbi:hypothetical protein M413DRAFT_448602 [Hebeloma cylindrosporum]|uniref:Major facilitator superfamily (MFS) profile domain-containing protein n=1 Tax=Hebeloma cylindrosporum TaxID=76867 RepID=A0A0C3BZ40_HEBCY|nr:hypothetical protein M413DRAFT_448602 [Hebeloma cylindrosporum h7]